MNNRYSLKRMQMTSWFNYFLDSEKGIIVDISECLKNKNLRLFQVEELCDNIIGFIKKDNNYYIGNSKYLNVKDTDKYIDEAFDEIGTNKAKNKNYLCLKHIGKYDSRYKTYEKLLKEIKDRNYKICGIPVEQYVNGAWNEKDENKFETNIMIPVEGKYE